MSCSVPVALWCALGSNNLFPGRVWHVQCGPHVFTCWCEERGWSAFWRYLWCEMVRALSGDVCTSCGMSVSVQGSNSVKVPQMCPQSLVTLTLKIFPANPWEAKHNWIPRWGLRQPKPGKDNVSSLGEDVERSWKPPLQSQGLGTNPALLLSWKPVRALQLLLQTWSDGQEKLNFRYCCACYLTQMVCKTVSGTEEK